ncbi:MAG: hypothetical protein ACLP0B_24865 [Steroidobacteraceae bacterium]|jgi:hypothetical protein
MQLTAEFVEGVLARLNKQATQPEIFEGSAKQERADVAALFRHSTESDGRLPARQLAHLVSVVQKHIEFETTITTTGGRAKFTTQPTIPNSGYIGAALVLLWLSEQGTVTDGFRVIECNHTPCKKLFLFKPGKRGRPPKFCQRSCGNAHDQATHRNKPHGDGK